MRPRIKAKIHATDCRVAADIPGESPYEYDFDITMVRTDKGINVRDRETFSYAEILEIFNLKPDIQPKDLVVLLESIDKATTDNEVKDIVTGPTWRDWLQDAAHAIGVANVLLEWKESNRIHVLLGSLVTLAKSLGA